MSSIINIYPIEPKRRLNLAACGAVVNRYSLRTPFSIPRGSRKMAKVVRLHAWKAASALQPRDTQWCWWPRIPGGHLTVVAGRGGSGKGLFAVDLTARITRGALWPCSKEAAPLGNVIFVETEDDFNETMMPRLIASGADTDRVSLLHPREFFSAPPSYITDNNVVLVVLSPLVSCLEGIEDTNKELDVRDRLDALMERYHGTGVAVLGLMHLNKKPELAAIERILGSGAFANYSRSVLFTSSEKDKESKLLMHEKHNLSVKADDLRFVPKSTRGARDQYIKVEWETTTENADTDAALDVKRVKRTNGHGAAQISAETWAVGYLTEKGGRTPKVDIVAAGVAAGYTKKALQHALDRTKKFRSAAPSADNRVTVWELITN